MNLICIQLLFNDLISISFLSFNSDYLNQNLFCFNGVLSKRVEVFGFSLQKCFGKQGQCYSNYVAEFTES